MEFFLQQDGTLGSLLFLVALLAGLLYLILPIFAWRIWFWSRQNSKHLQDISTKLELLIREIAPEALPIEEPAEEAPADESATEKETPTDETDLSLSEDEEESFFAEDELQGDFSEDDSMDFSMSDEFEDVTDDIADSEISDFTGDAADDMTAGLADEDESDDELVMDFDEEDSTEEAEGEATETEPDEEQSEELGDVFSEATPEMPAEIPVADPDSSDFTVEHFESNEEPSFEFEDVDDDSFGIPADTFDENEAQNDAAPVGTDSTLDSDSLEPALDEPATENIWGEEPTVRSEEEALSEETAPDDEFTFGAKSDVGSAFDEPAKTEKESVVAVADSFLNDLENKLNLDSLSQSAPEPAPKPEPLPEPAPEPKSEPAESQATLFARCEGCGHKLAYKKALSGKRVRCPACRTAFALP